MPSVQIVSPTQDATVSSPFTLQANCSSPSASISGWEVYIDSQTPPFFKNNTNSSSLDIPVTVASGSHSIDVKCWDVNGENGSSTIKVTVAGGLIPTPPTTATRFPDIDQMTGCQSCDDASCSSAPPASPTFAQNVASPSLDGRAIQASVANGPAFWGILWYRHLGAENSARNFVVEWNYRLNTGANPQALEFDFPLWSAHQSFYFGTQCDVAGGFWQYWIPGSTNHGWHNITQAACPAVTTDTWHKLRWYGTISGSTFTYNAMEIDGKQIAVNITVPAAPTSFGDNFTVQFQFDGRGSGA